MPYKATPVPMRRGQTYYHGQTPPTTYVESVPLEGLLVKFTDQAPPSSSVGAGTLTTNKDVIAMVVRNVSTIVLMPKKLVSWDAGYIGRRVDGYTDVAYDPWVAGVVDEWHTNGIPVRDLGYIIVEGPCTLITNTAADDTGTIAENADIVCATAAASTSTTQAGAIGVYEMIATATNAQTHLRGIIGRALSAKTSAQTYNDIRCYLTLLKA